MSTPSEEAHDPQESDPPVAVKPDTLPSPLGPPAAIMPASMEDDDDLDDEDLDETLSERLWGLTEMFPERLRSVTAGVTQLSWNGTKWLYEVGRVGLWVAASSATILALPVMFETERAQMEEQQLQQQRQILLGPNAAVAGAGPSLMPSAMPQVGAPSGAPR